MPSSPERRKVCVVTGSRAEYGLLRPLLDEIMASPALDLRLLVTGMHLAPQFGETWRAIAQDGYAIDEAVDMLIAGDRPLAMAKSVGVGVIGMADAIARIAPDLVVVLGDRFETFAAASAAALQRIPLVHLHGGELTEGAIDESLRHAITKLAHLHCVATEGFRRRLLQMGEAPGSVHVVGALGIDAIARTTLLERAALEAELGLALAPPLLLVTFHPETLSGRDPDADISELLAALDQLDKARVVLTMSNADPGGHAIQAACEAWAMRNGARARAVGSLGSRRYLSLLALADAVVGNSSSALIEAPALHTPAVNIGDRQKGRPRGPSVVDCPPERAAISAAVEQVLAPAFRRTACAGASPYGGPGAAARIRAVLEAAPLENLCVKRFHDVRFDA